MAQSNVDIGYNTTFKVYHGDPLVAFEPQGYEDIEFPMQERDEIDRTHQKSPGRTKEYGPGMFDNGVVTVPLQFVPGSETDVLFKSLLASGEMIQIGFTPNVAGVAEEKFAGFVKAYKRTAPVQDKQMSELQVRINGPVSE